MRKVQLEFKENKKVSGVETAYFRVQNLTFVECVYVIKVEEKVVYVGQTTNLQRRINDGYGNIAPANFRLVGGRKTNVKVNAKIVAARKANKKVSFEFAELENCKNDESVMINSLHPAWNSF